MLRVVRELWVCRLGTIEYTEGAALQERLRERVRDGELPDLMLLLEHPPVYTLGRRSQPGELPLGEEHYRARGIDVVRTRRGGKLTYHGPGQLVGYPIVHVADVPAYVDTIQRALIAALADTGIEARSRPGLQHTGVWVQDRKIASIGVHVSRGVSMHGFALNVTNDLAPFSRVVACGLPDVRMTSVAHEGSPEGIGCISKRVAWRLAQALGHRQRLVTPQRIGAVPVAA
jgi:lipoyl(octanoyl) transferase